MIEMIATMIEMMMLIEMTKTVMTIAKTIEKAVMLSKPPELQPSWLRTRGRRDSPCHRVLSLSQAVLQCRWVELQLATAPQMLRVGWLLSSELH